MSEERVVSDLVWTPEQGLASPEVRGIAWDNFLLSDEKYLGKWKTDSGVRVTPETALQSTVVLACCRILAETVSGLPIHVYRRNQDGSDDIAKEIPLYKILTFKPNEWQTKAEFFEQIMMNLTLWGNSYTRVRSGLYGSVSFLDNLHPSRMDVERLENGRLRYSYTDPETGRLERYTQDQIMHIRWTPEQDGIKGMVPVEIAREAIGLARACEQHAARFWANSARPGVVLQTDGTLTAEAAERLRDNWERLHRGSDRAYRTAILTGGLKAQELGMTNEASQFQSSRAFQTEEIGRVYRIPGHLIQGTPGGDLEVQGQEFVTYTLMPWLTRIESAISRSLIHNDDEFYAKFDVRGLLRGNSSARASFYSTMINLGVYTINDVRRAEGLKTLGAIGDHHFVPMNTQTLEDATKPKPEAPPGGGMPGMSGGGGGGPGGGDGPPPPVPGGPPSMSEVKTGKAPIASPKGEASKPKAEPQMEEAVEEASADWEDAIEDRAFCATGPGGGIDNSCGVKTMAGPDKDSGGGSIAAGDKSLANYKGFVSVGDTKNSSFATPPSEDEVKSALNVSQREKFGAQRDLEAGTPIDLRIDINAFKNHKVYAVTAHEHVGGAGVGKPIGYDTHIRLKGTVSFVSNENSAEAIGRGRAKGTHSTVKGNFDPSREIPADIDSWTPVGYDPYKAVYYYDKRTGDEVVAGTDAVSVGNTVFTKSPRYGNAKEPGKPPRNAHRDYRSLSAANQDLYDAQEEIVEENGKWPQADAHYMENNPFASRGMKCSNCLYYEAGQCEIVKGSVSPDGICKLWIIPEEKITAPEQRAFCPTGEGGGVDNSCGGKSSSSGDEDGKSSDGGKDKEADFGAVTKEILRSIDATGGYSVHPITAQSPTTGYMVATVPNAEEKIDGLEAVTEDRIRQYFDKHVEYLSKNPDLHLGGWFNLEDGKVYLDLSQRFESIDDAIDAAVDKKQLAIWDLNTKSEIRQENYDARRTRPKESRSVRLPSGRGSERDRGSYSQGGVQALGGESREGPDCGRGPGGIFGPGNKCQLDGDGSPSDAFGNPVNAKMRSPEGGGVAAARVTSVWKKIDGPVGWDSATVKDFPPAKSLAGVKSIAMLDGKTLSKSLKETGVTLDQAAKICGSMTPDANVTIGHGTLKDIVEYTEDPSLRDIPESSVTVVTKQEFGGVPDAIATAATLTRTDDDALILSYAMFSVAPDVQNTNAIAIGRELYKGVVKSINEAEKAGVDEVLMLAAGSDKDDQFKGYRIWPRLGFDGVIPRGSITPTYSLRLGFFEPYGSSIPDAILSSKAKAEKKAGALTIQSLYETSEGQKWWEQNGSTIEMSLQVGNDRDPGWQRFNRISERVSGRDILEVLDIEWRGIRDEVESRGFCATGDGGGIDNSCGAGTASAKVDNSWKKAGREYVYEPGEGKSPIVGGEDIKSLSIEQPKQVAAAMKDMKLKSLTDVVAVGGGLTRGAFTSIYSDHGGSSDGAMIHVMTEVPVDPDDEDSGSMASTVSLGVDEDGKRFVDYSTMNANSDAGTANLTGSDAARMSSILLEKFPESIAAAERAGFAYAKTFAMGDSQNEFKGYRLWPQFGFDAEIYPDVRETIPKDVIPHDDPVTIQELISTPEGDKWWNENGSSMGMTLNLKDKKSAGYKRYQRMAKLAERLKKRNEGRSLYDYLLGEERAFCPTGEGGGRDNSCSAGQSAATSPPVQSGKPASVRIDSQERLDKAISSLGASSVDDVISLGGGNLRGSDVGIAAMQEPDGTSYVQISTIAPVERDGSTSEKFFTDVSIRVGPDGKEMGFETLGMSHHGQMTKANEQKVMSLVAEKVVESVDKAEQLNFDRITTWAVGDRDNGYKGYRLWPQFGFDGDIPREIAKKIPAELVLKAKGIEPPAPGSTSIPHDMVLKGLASRHRNTLTIQELLKTTEGDRWWDKNGGDINLTLDLKDKSSLGYKRWEKMKSLLPTLRKRNQTRSFFDQLVEGRGFCPTGEGGGILNTCGNDDGGSPTDAFGGAVGGFERSPTAAKEKKGGGGGSSEPLNWEPGDKHLDVFRESVDSNPTKFGDDGQITSTSIPDAVVTRAIAGKFEVDPVSVGRYLATQQAAERGRPISTVKPLEGDDFEYMVTGVVSQVESAQQRGVAPNFYSPQDRKVQLEEYAKIHPLMRGGRTASGLCIGEEGPNGECEPSDDISPQAEFLFRAAQALTSPEATPFANMQRADAVLTKFFEDPNPATAKLGVGVSLAGAGAQNAKNQFARLQKIIDKIGLEETRKLFTAPPVRVGDFEKYFLSRLPETKGDKYEAGGFSVDEYAPPFSIFGPKVGPFFANNMGDPDPLTADIWFTRTWGRLSGELIEKTKPDLAKKHAATLMENTKHIDRKELAAVGLDGRSFRTDVSGMKKSGVIPQSVINWAEKRYKQFGKDGYPTLANGKSTPERYVLDRLSKSILDNVTRVLKAPTTTVMRSNMIKVMKEASVRTKVPVAYMQDILWQDEQDAWGTLGSRTTTQPGEPSLYSDVIRRLASDPNARKTKQDKRSLDVGEDQLDYQYLSDQKGGIEQAMFDEALSSVDDDTFAEIAIDFLRKSGKESRSVVESARDAVIELRSDGLTTVVMPNAGREGLHVMGFDADIPKDLAETLPETLSHCKTLLDLHVSSEGRSWWEQNGREIDVSIDLRGVQGRVFDAFVAGKEFSDILEEGILDEYGEA